MSKVTFRADDDLVERVEAHDASKSEVMRAALRAYLDGETGSERRGEAADTGGRDDTGEADDERGTVDERAATDERTLTEVIDAVVADRIETLVERRVTDRLDEVSADTGEPWRADDTAPRRRGDEGRPREYGEPAPRRPPSREPPQTDRPRRTRQPPTVVVEVPSRDAVSDGRERQGSGANARRDHRASEPRGRSPSDAVADRPASEPTAGRDPSDTAGSASGRSPDGDVSDTNERSDRHTASDTSPSCGQCGSELSDDHVYCPNCGEKATRRLFCECGDEVRSDWSFCPGCGRRTPTADVLDRPTGEPNTRRR